MNLVGPPRYTCLGMWPGIGCHGCWEIWSTKSIFYWHSMGILCTWVVVQWVRVAIVQPVYIIVKLNWTNSNLCISSIGEFILGGYHQWDDLLPQLQWWMMAEDCMAWCISDYLTLVRQLVGFRLVVLAWRWVSACAWVIYPPRLPILSHHIPVMHHITHGMSLACPVGGYPGRLTSRIALQIHFMHRHVQDTVVILEEGSHPLPRYPKCDIFVTWSFLNGRHQAS